MIFLILIVVINAWIDSNWMNMEIVKSIKIKINLLFIMVINLKLFNHVISYITNKNV